MRKVGFFLGEDLGKRATNFVDENVHDFEAPGSSTTTANRSVVRKSSSLCCVVNDCFASLAGDEIRRQTSVYDLLSTVSTVIRLFRRDETPSVNKRLLSSSSSSCFLGNGVQLIERKGDHRTR